MASRVRVDIIKGPKAGKILLFERQASVVFGRGDDCYEQMSNQDLRVGRRHFLLDIAPPIIKVADLTSKNGTLVNGQRIGGTPNSGEAKGEPSGLQATVLQSGDQISAGQTTILVSVEITAACSSCGADTAVWLPPPADQVRVLCSACSSSRLDSKAPQAEVQHDRPVCRNCGVQVLRGTSEVGGEVICDSCRSRLLGDKKRVEALVTRCFAVSAEVGSKTLDDYQIRKPIGKGPIGTVYYAVSRKRKTPVAVKVMVPRALSGRIVTSCLSSIEQLKQISHSNLVRLIDYGFADGSFVLVSEYCDAGNLLAFLRRREGVLGLNEAFPIIAQCLDGLAHAHRHGCCHTGLKLQNILFCSADRSQSVTKISDLGLNQLLLDLGLKDTASAESAESLCLTPPEMLNRRESACPASDVWSIAAIAYFLLTGKYPCQPDDTREVPDDTGPTPPIPIRERDRRIPAGLAAVLDRALSIAVRDRFDDADQMLQEMRTVAKSLVRLTICT